MRSLQSLQSKRGALLLAVACALTAAAPARAQEDAARPGFYVGGGLLLGVTNQLESEAQKLTGLSYVFQPAFGIRGIAGYRILSRLAAEVDFDYMLTDYTGEEGGSPDIDVSSWLLTANAKGYVLTGQWQPYLYAGVGVMNGDPNTATFSGSATEFAARFGLGIDIVATDHITLGFDFSYVLPTGDLKKLDYFSFGLFNVMYRF